MDINISGDLEILNNQIGQLVEKLNELNSEREALMGRIQQLNGAAMYLRGKSETENNELSENTDETFERSVEYPEESTNE